MLQNARSFVIITDIKERPLSSMMLQMVFLRVLPLLCVMGNTDMYIVMVMTLFQ